MSCLDKKKELVVGTMLQSNDSCIAELFGRVGYDFVWIDAEHGPLDKGDILKMIMAAQGAGIAAFVRVAWNDPVLVKPIIDMGADGIIFPMTFNAEDARRAVRSCLYPPAGNRSSGPIRVISYGFDNELEYIKKSDSSIWKILQIEHIDAVNNLDEILSVEGIDTIHVGPWDLSGSIGLLAQTEHPEVQKLCDIIEKKVKEHRIPFGAGTGPDVKSVEKWVARGVSWVNVSADYELLVKSASEILREVRNLKK